MTEGARVYFPNNAFQVEPPDALMTVSNFMFDLSRRDRRIYTCICGARLLIRCTVLSEGHVSCNRCERAVAPSIEA